VRLNWGANAAEAVEHEHANRTDENHSSFLGSG
jgi:hypothetical protein